MAIGTTPYLGMEYNGDNDTAFRDSYVKAMDTFDSIAVSNYGLDGGREGNENARLRFPENRQPIFDDSIFAPRAGHFKLEPKQTRYIQIGERFYYEVQVRSLKSIEVNASGNITNYEVGTFSSEFTRRFGQYILSINHVAAAYNYQDNKVFVASFGGQSQSKTVPSNTIFAFGGNFSV